MTNSISLVGILSLITLLPFLIASGTCYVKFSIVFVIVRNALGLQQVPSNMTLNGIALILAIYVMSPVLNGIYDYSIKNEVTFEDVSSIENFLNTGLDSYKSYLTKYSDPKLVSFFENLSSQQNNSKNISDPSVISLLPAYALSEIKDAFKIGFYIYLPFVVVDLVISCILLTLGMMMMSPVTISTPIKLILFVVMDGWSLLTKGLILQYMDLASS